MQSRKKEIIKVRAEINEIENRQKQRKMTKPKAILWKAQQN